MGDHLEMPNPNNLKNPWLVATWPGMGAVGISASYYLMAKLGMHQLAEFPAREFFELDSVDVKDGLIKLGRLPRSRLFLGKDPLGKHDLIVFIGEAQPPTKGDAFCRQLIDYVRKLGVERVFTFAAMAAEMHPRNTPRVFGAAIDRQTLQEFKDLELEIMSDGQITGLNGVLLGIAAENGMSGGCLLGEMPHVFPQLPFPKGSHAVLNIFRRMAGCEVDLTELEHQGKQVEEQLEELLERVQKSVESMEEEGETSFESSLPEIDTEESEDTESSLDATDRQHIEDLFDQAAQDRSRAYKLKQELDRLRVFSEYEDRFLDLFKEPR